MTAINFLTPIVFEDKNKPCIKSLLEIVDGYFDLGGKQAHVYADGNVKLIEEHFPSYFITALKVISYCTIIIPLIMLIAKAILRYKFSSFSHAVKVIAKEVVTLVKEVPSLIKEDSSLAKKDDVSKDDVVVEIVSKDPSKEKHDVYLTTLQHGRELYRNNNERIELANRINPIEKYLVIPLAARCTNSIHKGLKWAWSQSGQKYISSDPITTEEFLKIGEKIEDISRTITMQEPVKYLLVNSLHKCAVVAARHLFIISRDMNSVLRLPQATRDKIEIVFKVANEEIIDKMAQDYLKDPQAKENESKTWLDYGKDLLRNTLVRTGAGGASKMLEGIKNTATNEVTKKEKELREKVVAVAADKISRAAVSFGVHWAIRSAIVFTAFTALENIPFGAMGLEGSLFTQSLPYVTSNVAKVAALVLWARCLQPTASRLQDDYEKEFDSEATLFSSLPVARDLLGYLPKVTGMITHPLKSNKYLNSFQERLRKEF